MTLSAISAVLVLLALQATSALAQVFNCVGGTVYIIAHPDDDLLFQSPDLQTDVSSQACLTTVILTAGDSGSSGSTYSLSREQGNAAAYAQMAGVASTWTEFTTTLGGQQVLVTTLKGAPHIQRVHFRLPDGNMDGSGFPSTGYQSLRNLYFGSISQIRNQPGTATFTLSALKRALGEILTARQPSWVRTLDNLSDFDAGDHADHLASGRIASEVASQYAANSSVAGYMGYPVQNLPPTMGLDDGAFIAKRNAFFSYTPFDYAECQSLQECYNAGRGETYWLLRQYVVSEDLAEQSYTGSAEAPVALPDSDNVAPLGQAFASSSSSVQPASAAIDGNVQGYPGNYSAEWASNGERTTAWWGVLWPDLYKITEVALFDRPNSNDWIQGGTLEFSDGSSVSFGALANDGSATLVSLGGYVVTQSIRMTVTSVSASTGSVGLAEFRAYGTACPGCKAGNSIDDSATSTQTSAGVVSGNGAYADLALQAHAFASSSFAQQGPDRAIDGVISGYPANASAEWASYRERTPWINLTWDAYYLVDSLVLWDRPNQDDWVTGATVAFSDGSSLPVGALNNDGSATVLNLSSPVNTSSIKLSVTSAGSSTSSAGLSEIGVFYSQPQTPVNLTLVGRNPGVNAPVVGDLDDEDWADDLALQNATVTVSSSAPGQPGVKAINGQLGGYLEDGSGDDSLEWSSDNEGAGAFFNISWPYTVKVEQVSLFDRPNLVDQVTGSILIFDDGSFVSTGPLNNDGSATNISVPGIVTTSIKMLVTAVSPSTAACGLSEFAVFGSIPLAGNGSALDNSTVPLNSTLPSNTTLPLNNATLSLNSTTAFPSSTLLPNATSSSLSGSATLNATASSVLSGNATLTSFVSSSTASASLNASSTLFNSSALASSTGYNASSTAAPSVSFNMSSSLPSATSNISSSLLPSSTINGSSSATSASSMSGNLSSTVSASASSVSSTLSLSANFTSVSMSASASSSTNSTSVKPASATASALSSGGNSTSRASSTASAALSATASTNASTSASSFVASSASSMQSASLGSTRTSGSATLSASNSSSVSLPTTASSLSASASLNASSVSNPASSTSTSRSSSSSLASSTASSTSSALPSSTSTLSASVRSSSASLSASSTTSSSASASRPASSSSSLAASSSGMVTLTRSSSAVPSSSSTAKASSTSAPSLPTATVASTVNIARLAGVTVKASSSIAKSPPSGAVDGNTGGVSFLGFGNAAQEWVSTGTDGQWIELSFPAKYLLKDVYLVGRTNFLQSITDATLNFTDGTLVNLPSGVPSSGGHVSLGSAGIYASGVRLTVKDTSFSTTQAGLAEIELYSRAPPFLSNIIGTLGR